MSKAIVYIEEMDSVADVTFPAVPQVVSLLMYDDTAKSKENPHPPTGYPVVCVTVRFLSNLLVPCSGPYKKIEKVFNSGKRQLKAAGCYCVGSTCISLSADLTGYQFDSTAQYQRPI